MSHDGSMYVWYIWFAIYHQYTPNVSWLVVWLPFFIFPYIGNNHPNWLIFFRGVAQPPTSQHVYHTTGSVMAIFFHHFPRVFPWFREKVLMGQPPGLLLHPSALAEWIGNVVGYVMGCMIYWDKMLYVYIYIYILHRYIDNQLGYVVG